MSSGLLGAFLTAAAINLEETLKASEGKALLEQWTTGCVALSWLSAFLRSWVPSRHDILPMEELFSD